MADGDGTYSPDDAEDLIRTQWALSLKAQLQWG